MNILQFMLILALSVKPFSANAQLSCRQLVASAQHVFFEINKLSGESYLQSMNEILNQRSLFTLSQEVQHQAELVNNMTLKYLHSPIHNTITDSKRLPNLNRTQAQEVFSRVVSHPVADRNNLRKYDPNGSIGFCFGRAMAAHLELIKYGVQKNRIRKIWAVGNLKAGGVDWAYHVATIVKADNGSWWAIDPIFERPIKVEDWISKMKPFDSDNNMTIFTSEAKRFGPWIQAYTSFELNLDHYNNYFRDLLNYYKPNNPQSFGLLNAAPYFN